MRCTIAGLALALAVSGALISGGCAPLFGSCTDQLVLEVLFIEVKVGAPQGVANGTDRTPD
jgi:hypothetical protein